MSPLSVCVLRSLGAGLFDSHCNLDLLVVRFTFVGCLSRLIWELSTAMVLVIIIRYSRAKVSRGRRFKGRDTSIMDLHRWPGAEATHRERARFHSLNIGRPHKGAKHSQPRAWGRMRMPFLIEF